MRADDPEAIAGALARAAGGGLGDAAGRARRAEYTYPAPAERIAAAVELAIAAG